ncbi:MULTISPECIES: TIGR03885 family FMN-dependent LLM class oxidoreductase [unclassified Siphonobacter]|uniref:TIGR03885 family FMN-dependent LLM class oxidoreductase n=1 Tax=unclassified Siphonobacter TaxID=2635712 RepID=UPI0027890B1D|nr:MULTISPECIES: TIGR03885 family FMN-dependent LLM class oxidoreductase [unclassified Siphonobacter]MDQ1089737.1 coenzyme F420-dependent glucose-6-phosphate dehydrogenase [Siphonobacter sp. SORGH_AS_1065]MDR6197191.1 coenzyme F420-dependent glucose-6-phosphate dehydrogenase [Siphonobacter sp. SORGH_AS_0500]
MLKIGYHSSHEQFKPSLLLKLVQQAQQAGFTAGSCSDHFNPWTTRQGESGFAWSWLAAALQATSLDFGVVNAPGQRYHPAIIAQAAATLAEMFPERFWIAVGSGQALNEHITGDQWPRKEDRNQRLKECVDIIRALWAGETVTHKGLVTVDEAKLYTRPVVNPLIVGAAITPQTAQWVGGWADALITVSQPMDDLKKVVNAFRRGGGENKPMFLKVQLSYARSQQEAQQMAHEQWKSNVLPNSVLTELRNPSQFDDLGDQVNPAVIDKMIHISADPAQHVAWLQQYVEMGFERLMLHNVNTEQELFINAFGEKVLPQLLK